MGAMSAPLLPFQVLPRDLSAYRAGNTGIDYVHRFASGQPGPHVMINGLTHGNEFCGMTAVCHLVDSGVRPKIGTLTLSFANVAAYESFDPVQPFESRQNMLCFSDRDQSIRMSLRSPRVVLLPVAE